MRAGVDTRKTSPARKWRAMGRIEQTLLDGEFSVRPNRPKTIARYHTIPQKVTTVSIYAKGPEPNRPEGSDPMIEASAPSTGKIAMILESCPPTGGSHVRTTGIPILLISIGTPLENTKMPQPPRFPALH